MSFAENSFALKVCLSGREAGRDLLFLFSCKVTDGAGSRPDSFVLFSVHGDDDDLEVLLFVGNILSVSCGPTFNLRV